MVCLRKNNDARFVAVEKLFNEGLALHQKTLGKWCASQIPNTGLDEPATFEDRLSDALSPRVQRQDAMLSLLAYRSMRNALLLLSDERLI